MALLFIPRDLRAPIPGHGRQPIAAAYRMGGPLLTLETVKSLTGLPINHFLDVDFQAFIDIVNALGGVHSTVPPGLGSPPGPSWAAAPLQPGYHLLDGRQLLSYVRLEEDVYGGEGWLAGQGTIFAELRRQLATQVDWSHPLSAMRVFKDATRNTLSDIAGLRGWYDTAKLFTDSEHGGVIQARLEGPRLKERRRHHGDRRPRPDQADRAGVPFVGDRLLRAAPRRARGRCDQKYRSRCPLPMASRRSTSNLVVSLAGSPASSAAISFSPLATTSAEA